MRRFVRNGAGALLLLAFAACSDTTGPQSVAAARILWESQQLNTYTYFGSKACFCGGPNGQVRVDVSGGLVTSVWDQTTNTRLSTMGWLTVDQLFDLAESAQPEVLEFDGRLGFPRKMERRAADDTWFIYTISSVVQLNVPN